MDKPDTMSTREFITKKISQEQSIDHHIVKTVINDMFREANNALTDNNSIEIAGFGRFTFNHKKAVYRMKKYESQLKVYQKKIDDPNTTEVLRQGFQLKINGTNKYIEHLKYKMSNGPKKVK